jgi:predicted TIM-barrel fold metal-dependent hydrolase
MGKLADAFRGVALPEQKKMQMLALDKKFSEMEAEINVLKAENLNLQAKVNPLEREVERLQKEIEQNSSTNPSRYVCDHCGSPRLKRTGSRPDPIFQDVGVKQAVFSCLACGKESAFTQEP